MEEEKQKARRHVQVPNSVSTNLGSDKKSKTNKQYTDVIIYGFLRKDMVKETMTAFVSLRNIAAALQMSVGGITAAVKRLEEAGDIIKVKSKGGKSSNGYQFNPHSDKFEMFDHAFLDNTELSTQNKAFYMLMQPHLYLDTNDGIGKTTYSDIKISEITGISKTVVRERRKELEKLGFVTKRLTTDVNGHSCEALEFNLMKFGQHVMCKFEQIDSEIAIIKKQHAMEMADMKKEIADIKRQVYKEGLEEIAFTIS